MLILVRSLVLMAGCLLNFDIAFAGGDHPELLRRFSSKSIGSTISNGEHYLLYRPNTQLYLDAWNPEAGPVRLQYSVNGSAYRSPENNSVEFNHPGPYHIRVRATDGKGQITEDQVKIIIGPKVLLAE